MSIRAQGQGLAMTDFRTGDVRTLYPVSEDHFVAGPAIAVPGSVDFDFQFQRDEKKAVSGATVKPMSPLQLSCRAEQLHFRPKVATAELPQRIRPDLACKRLTR